MKLKHLTAVLMALGHASVALAAAPFTIQDIRVEGLQRTEPATVFNYLPVKVGDTFTDAQGEEIIKTLYATGFFDDVRVETLGNHILLTVVDLARMLGLPAARSEQAFASASVVALNPMMGVNTALFVEQLEGLRGTNDFAGSSDTPDDAPAFFGALYTTTSGEQWQELNLQLLANAADFLDITA